MGKTPARKHAIMTMLAERFPAAFVVWEVKRPPLKIGIHEDIIARLGGAIEARELGLALSVYCENIAYLRTMMLGVGMEGIDLDGNAAGTVTVEAAAMAAKQVAARALKAANRKKPAPTPSGPKRLSLADLRQQALARKQNGRIEWCAVVNRMPADWFPRETHGMLVQYCRLIVGARRLRN